MKIHRILKHLVASSRQMRRLFPSNTLRSIEQAVKTAESRHGGEIRFAVEVALGLPALLRGQTARERAIEMFAQLRVWDTEDNNGVLIYLLLAEHDVEIVADRGFNGRVSHQEWEAVCARMESEFRLGHFKAGALAGIGGVSDLMARHYPIRTGKPNELPDHPTLT